MTEGRTNSDAAQLTALLSPILRDAYGLAFTLTRNGADAEDLVQTAALRALRSFATFALGTNFKAWFYRILTNLFFETRRRLKRELDTIDLDDVCDGHLFRATAALGLHEQLDDPAGALFRRVTSEQVRRALYALPEEYSVVATLYFAGDLAYREIAEALDLPVGTVRSRLHRARGMLQKSLWTVALEAGVVARSKEGSP